MNGVGKWGNDLLNDKGCHLSGGRKAESSVKILSCLVSDLSHT